MITLYELLESIHVLETRNLKNMDITGIAYNSKKVTQGNVFVCIKGYKTDGHKYIPDAIKNGAIAAVVEDFQEGWDIPQIRVANSREALAALGDKFYGSPSKDMKIIGITASNGKTTTSFMTNAILRNNGFKTGLIGTVKVEFGDYSEPSMLTTPESLDLHRYFYQMKAHNVSHVCMEVSSAALELNRVGNVDFDIVALNNISREHIDFHGSFEKYFNSKASLIRNAEPHQWAILNLDCPYSASLVNQTRAKVLTYGIKNENGDLWCKDIDLSTGRAKFTVSIRKTFKLDDNIIYTPEEFDIELRTPGFHSVYNAMVAIMVGLLCGVPVPAIQKTLRTFTGVERRFEIVFEDDFKIIDDHFANSGNIDVTLKTLEMMDYKNLKLVYAIRGSRGVTVNRENAEVIASWAPKLHLKEIIATLSRSHVTDKDVVQDEEIEAFQEVMRDAGIKVYLYEELPDAIAHALSTVEKGDVMLLAGCQGMDCGARIALEQLSKLRPSMDKERLFEPLVKRIAGMNN
ncbi:MAG: UDP-N-acetylmuramoyl-L-alanyl-D-glutamate--2,6-diaminopimelate ligase [Clostridiaceae bacterium]|nr:UDP-N-acetylmuramoyl-L-alanyl-D-glutamate--2,6-diaminopimelate ligase [Clostridiaceae bacterium]